MWVCNWLGQLACLSASVMQPGPGQKLVQSTCLLETGRTFLLWPAMMPVPMAKACLCSALSDYLQVLLAADEAIRRLQVSNVERNAILDAFR